MDIYDSPSRPEITANDAVFFQVAVAAHIVWSNQRDCQPGPPLYGRRKYHKICIVDPPWDSLLDFASICL